MFDDKDYSLYDGIPKQFRYIRNKEFEEWEIPPWDVLIQKDKLIGKGEFGSVYLATWNETEVVVKIMNSNLKQKDKQLFLNEYDTLSKAHHPNIVQLLGYINEPFMIIMEYLPKNNLLYYIENKILSNEEKISICLDILKGIHYLHNRKPQSIVHRDIKPQNIILTETRKAKIGDFGLSKLFCSNELNKSFSFEKLDSSINKIEVSNLVGTKRYMSPELKKNSTYNHKIDIWALGIMFYELFENKRYKPDFVWTKTPIEIQNIIVQYMLREEPKNRLSSLELIQTFNHVNLSQKQNCSCNIQ